MRELIVDAAIKYVALDDLIDELESALGWDEGRDVGLSHAIAVAHDEAEDARRRLMGLVRTLLNQEGHNNV